MRSLLAEANSWPVAPVSTDVLAAKLFLAAFFRRFRGVEDEGVFTKPWSAAVSYRRPLSPLGQWIRRADIPAGPGLGLASGLPARWPLGRKPMAVGIFKATIGTIPQFRSVSGGYSNVVVLLQTCGVE
jgi:hypothetical protein